MFKDILGPDQGSDQEQDNTQSSYDKEPEAYHSSDCQCEDCLEEAIKQLCDQMGIDLGSEELEDIKIEYYNNEDDENFSLSCKLYIAMARKFHKDVVNGIRNMNWKKQIKRSKENGKNG